MNVIAAASETVVRVPGDVRGQHRDLRSRLAWRDNPGKGKEPSRFALGVKVIQSRALRRGDELLVMRARVAKLVPSHTCLRVVTFRRDLHGRSRAVLVEPADRPHQ